MYIAKSAMGWAAGVSEDMLFFSQFIYGTSSFVNI